MPSLPITESEIEQAFSGVSLRGLIDDSGGFKAVYKAEIGGQLEVFKVVALPGGSTPQDKANRSEHLGRIQREVRLLGQLATPTVVKLGAYTPEIVEIRGIDYLGYSEEFLDGPNLWKLVRTKCPKVPEDEAITLLLSLLEAIQELWTKHKAIHRDIKPQNVVKLNDPNRPFVLLDLGIAFATTETGLTQQPIGPSTPRYMAPELVKFDYRTSIDFRTDLYTSALTVFEYSAQMHPLAKTADDLIMTISRAVTQPPRKLEDERPDYSPGFCKIVNRFLAKQPALRGGNITNLIAIVQQLRP